LNQKMRCLLADVAGEGEHEGFRKEIPPGSFHIGAHAVGAHLQPGKQGREQGMGLACRHGQLRHGVPFHLPRPAITLMVVNQALGKKPSICPHYTGQGSEMFGHLRVALMWHSDTADPFGAGSFAKLSDLVALEVVNLMPDSVGGAGGEHEQMRPFG